MKNAGETIYKLSKSLGVDIETLISDSMKWSEIEKKKLESYECGLPNYLQHDLDAFKEGLKNKSSLMDCLWGELYGSINMAEISDGLITHEHAEYLRNKYLWSDWRQR